MAVPGLTSLMISFVSNESIDVRGDQGSARPAASRHAMNKSKNDSNMNWRYQLKTGGAAYFPDAYFPGSFGRSYRRQVDIIKQGDDQNENSQQRKNIVELAVSLGLCCRRVYH